MSLQLSGLVGGLVATVAMTALMMAMGDDSPPPTAQLWAKYVGDGPAEEYVVQGMVLHFLYGIGAGWVFGLIAAFGLLALTPLNLVNGVVNGAVYGIILTVVAAVVWMRLVLGMEPDTSTLGPFTLMHLVYGVVLGAFLGLGILF
jgi:uncharacterized membrane protein YagU involved in acid resistance